MGAGCSTVLSTSDGVSLLEATAEDAHKTLDDYARLYRNAYPFQWYHAATDEQLDLFYAD